MSVEHVAASGDRALAYYWIDAVAPDGMVVESRYAAVVRVRDGRLWRWEAFLDVTRSLDWLAATAQGRGDALTAA